MNSASLRAGVTKTYLRAAGILSPQEEYSIHLQRDLYGQRPNLLSIQPRDLAEIQAAKQHTASRKHPSGLVPLSSFTDSQRAFGNSQVLGSLIRDRPPKNPGQNNRGYNSQRGGVEHRTDQDEWEELGSPWLP